MSSSDKHRTKEKYNRLVKKYVNLKGILAIIIILFLVLTFSNALKGLILLLMFFPLAKYSVKVTAFVPHITLEQYTSSTILMSYLFGPFVGSLSGLVLGLYGYLSNSISKFLALTNVFVAAITGLFIGYAKDGILRGMSFSRVFIIGIVFFNFFAYFVFLYLDPDQLQNIVYRASHLFINALISVLFFTLIYNVFTLI